MHVDPAIEAEGQQGFEEKHRLYEGVLHEAVGRTDGGGLIETAEESDFGVLGGKEL